MIALKKYVLLRDSHSPEPLLMDSKVRCSGMQEVKHFSELDVLSYNLLWQIEHFANFVHLFLLSKWPKTLELRVVK